MDEILGKHVELTIDRPELLLRIAHALSAPVRVQVLQELGKHSMNIGELAEALDVPMSTTALAVKILEESGLITVETQPGVRGSKKLCSRRVDTLGVTLAPEDAKRASALVLQMPVGGYSVAEGIKPTCGLAGPQSYIGRMDNPASFYVPERFGAQLVWFRQGALEYRFTCVEMAALEIDWLELSFEACSEGPMHRDPWPSDITVSINGRRIGTWTSPCDCGGRPGRLTPAWWPELSTQHGFLKTWRVDEKGSFLDNLRVSDTTIQELNIRERDHICVRIEVPPDAENVGGLNLFGEGFGDFEQPLVIRLGYHIRES